MFKIKREKNIVEDAIKDFTSEFNRYIKRDKVDCSEINDDIIRENLTEFFNKKKLTEAQRFMYNAVDKYVDGKDAYKNVDWSLEREEMIKTESYKQYQHHDEISSIWSACYRKYDLDGAWAEVNGQVRTDEEAAKIAADKWCELMFKWHLQDNGALNESHGGGFPACALGTILAEKGREGITDEMKTKAHKLLSDYYIKQLHFSRTYDLEDVQWLKNNLPNKEGNGDDWKYGFHDLSCDYGPSMGLYLVLYNAGIPEKSIDSICPWKTRITIRKEDNTVMYDTYQHRDEL